MDERYEQLDVRSDTFFTNNLNINYYNLKKNLEKINEPVNKTTWSKSLLARQLIASVFLTHVKLNVVKVKGKQFVFLGYAKTK